MSQSNLKEKETVDAEENELGRRIVIVKEGK
jgi:hypothetical protein